MKTKLKRPKSHVFDDKKYQIVWQRPDEDSLGECAPPTARASNRKIFLDPNLPPKKLYEVILHESLHAEQWYLDEDTVVRIASNLAELLSKCNLIVKVDRN